MPCPLLRHASRAVLGAALALTLLPAGAGASRIERLGWLAGCWANADRADGSGEIWMAPAAGSMFGVGRSIRDAKLRAFEFMSIREDDAGRLAFDALPSGQAATRFDERGLDDDGVVFENAGHDFPQRVSYRRLGDGRALGRIEGTLDGQTKQIDFPLRRVDCPR